MVSFIASLQAKIIALSLRSRLSLMLHMTSLQNPDWSSTFIPLTFYWGKDEFHVAQVSLVPPNLRLKFCFQQFVKIDISIVTCHSVTKAKHIKGHYWDCKALSFWNDSTIRDLCAGWGRWENLTWDWQEDLQSIQWCQWPRYQSTW